MSQNEFPSTRRKLLAASVCALGGVGLGAIGTVLVGSLRPSRTSLAATLEGYRQVVNVSDLKPGEFKQIEVLGLPVMLLHRTHEQLMGLEKIEDKIADPTSQVPQQPAFAQNRFRSQYPELLVVRPICTHLGCTANYFAAGDTRMWPEWSGGFYCACHSAIFDLAGRVHKGMPAPTNMLVPHHKFLTKNEVQFGHPEYSL